MNNELPPEIIGLAEEHRNELSSDFFVYYDDLERQLGQRRLPERLRTRGETSEVWYSELGPAIIDELRLFLCTNDERYASVREKGEGVGQTAIAAIAGSLAAQFGLAVGATTGAVAFIALAVMKIGVSVFCRLTSAKQTS